ncbi:MAG TPA: hypothetical protein VGC30_08905 [Dokdonella sp.]
MLAAVVALLALRAPAPRPPASAPAPHAAPRERPAITDAAFPASVRGGARAASTPRRAPVAAVARLYAVRDRDELRRLAEARPGDPDVLYALDAIAHICDDFDGTAAEHAALRRYADAAAVEYFEAERRRLCGGTGTAAPPVDAGRATNRFEDALPDAYAATDDTDFRTLLDVTYGTDAAPDTDDAQKQALLAIVRDSASPYLLMHAGELLAERFGVDWNGAAIEAPFGESEDAARFTVVAAYVLAACAWSGGCDAGAWQTLRYCMPLECVPDTSVESSLRRRLSEAQFARARAAAEAIEHGRRHG